VLGLAMALVGLYLGSFTVRALTVPRSVRGFEVVQTLAVLPIGFGGPLTLSLAFSFFGAALLVAPRLVKWG
jgi:hypothetical protein